MAVAKPGWVISGSYDVVPGAFSKTADRFVVDGVVIPWEALGEVDRERWVNTINTDFGGNPANVSAWDDLNDHVTYPTVLLDNGMLLGNTYAYFFERP